MSRLPKRAHEVIDLSGDDDSSSQAKRPALSSRQSSNLSIPANSNYSSGPSSAAFSAPSSTAAEEPGVLDLTQDDGPARELYGTLGMLVV